MGENSNSDRATVRADIQMRLVMDAKSYGEVGRVMDAIDIAMRTVLGGHPHAAFDFVGFQTYPCKAIAMDERVWDDEPRPQQAPQQLPVGGRDWGPEGFDRG